MSKRVYQLILDLPEMIEKAIHLTQSALKGKQGLWQRFQPQNLIISGMGGSGIGGEILKDLANKYSPVPVIPSHDYTIPNLTGKGSLFLAVSYSGNTEETISAYRQAKERKALICIITSGGELKKMAEAEDDLLILIPPGLPPRQALGFLLTPLLVLSSQKKLLPFTISVIRKSAIKLKGWLTECSKIAQSLAKSFYQKIPYILAGSSLYTACAYRWKCQLNENSKTLAFFNTLPEENHNEIEGIGRPKFMRNFLSIVVLFDPTAEERIKLRIRLLPTLLRGQFFSFQEVAPLGANDLERILSLLLIGDLTSYYLGRKYKKDIEKIERIERLKALLGELTSGKKEL